MYTCELVVFFDGRIFMGITSEQEHRGITVQQGGVKVRNWTTHFTWNNGENVLCACIYMNTVESRFHESSIFLKLDN